MANNQSLREAHEILSSTHATLVSTSSGHADVIAALQRKLEETNAAHEKALHNVDGELSAQVKRLSEELEVVKNEKSSLVQEQEALVNQNETLSGDKEALVQDKESLIHEKQLLIQEKESAVMAKEDALKARADVEAVLGEKEKEISSILEAEAALK